MSSNSAGTDLEWLTGTGLERLTGMYTRLQTVWSLPGHSRQANKGHSPRCYRRPNGPGRLADKVVQPTTQSEEGCTYVHMYISGMADITGLEGLSAEVSLRSEVKHLIRSWVRSPRVVPTY